jgi:hypothetical protein
VSIDVHPERPARIRRGDRGFLTRNPWGVRRDLLSRTLVWLPLALVAAGLARTADRTSLAALGALAGLLALRALVELRRETRRGWVVVGTPEAGARGERPPREPVWHDPSGEWVTARDSGLWRPLRSLIALVPLLALVFGLPGQEDGIHLLGWLVSWPVLLYLFRHVPTGSRYDVAYHCAPCRSHGAYRLCRRCGRESADVRPPTLFGSLRRRWRSF